MNISQSLHARLPNLTRFFVPAIRPSLRNLFSVFFSLALLHSATAQAQTPSELSKVWFNAGFYSAHFDTDKGLRNPNPGFGIEYKLTDDLSLTAGGFTNSDNAHSNYLGAYYQPWRLGGVKLGGWAVYLMAIQKLLMAVGFLRCCQSQAGSLKT